MQGAQRVLSAQEQLHRIEQLKMAVLERRSAELERQQVELIAALNDHDALHGLFIDATARRLSAIAEEAERLKRDKAAQSLKVNEQAVRVRVSERLYRARSQDFQRDKEGKDLLEIVELIVGRERTSLP